MRFPKLIPTLTLSSEDEAQQVMSILSQSSCDSIEVTLREGVSVKAINYLYSNYKTLNIKRAVILPVSASFHCELMKSASKKMQDEIVKYKFQPFEVPLYSNVTSEICTHDKVNNLLVDQIVSKVRWREIIENMIRDGVRNFIEIGPGKVLSGLVKRINKTVNSS